MISILGISAFYHDSAAALIIDGNIVAAAQEERFTRKKHDSNFPKNCINFILKKVNMNLEDIDHIIFYEKPFLKFERLLETYVANSPKGFTSFRTAMPIWLKEKLFQKSLITDELKQISNNYKNDNLFFSEHHYSHASSAFFPSPFEEAIVLTIDGVGEWATTTVGIGKKNKLKIIKEINFPHSIGLLYSAFTYYLGFKVNSGEYKVMGLAPYGEPHYKDIILNNLIDLKKDGSFKLNQSYFNYSTGLTMINRKFEDLFKEPVRKSEDESITQFHMDIAASIQFVTEEIILRITKNLSKDFKIKNLCMAGGVALNCVVNGKILKNGFFDNIWIQPAAGDAGGALGAALLFWYKELGNTRKLDKNLYDKMNGSYLGPEFSDQQIEVSLKKSGAIFNKYEEKTIIDKTAKALTNQKIVGWFQGKMEYGPRALGSRSILADPRSSKMQKNLNLKIKYRESFRPFAPSITRENLSDWFNLETDSPYMLLVANLNNEKKITLNQQTKKLFGIDLLNIKRSLIPAVTHVDYSARIQTVHSKTNKKYYNLIKKFNEYTNVPILVNTSFNVRGEPIVCNPQDAFNCFMGTEIDILVIGNFFLLKDEQNKKLLKDYKNKYELD